MTDKTLQALERDAYRESYSDGIIDLFFGLSLVWIGAAWIWLPDFAGLAGVITAVFVTAVLAWRKKVVESRAGYVQWSGPRRRWEQRNFVAVFLAGVVLFLLAIGTFVAFEGAEASFDKVGPAILAWLLALLATGLAFIMDAKRLLMYALALLVSGAIAAATDSNPGWPLLASGVAITISGTAMLTMYRRRYPQQADGS